MAILNGSTKTVVALIDHEIAELSTRLEELRGARRELLGHSKPGSTGPVPQGTAKKKNWTPGDQEKLRAVAKWAGSDEFDVNTASKELKIPVKSFNTWCSRAYHAGKMKRPEKGVYSIDGRIKL